MAHISQNQFQKLNWLPISDRIDQYVLSSAFKFVTDVGPNYLNEVFQRATESNKTLRLITVNWNTHFKKQLLVKTRFLSYVPQNGANWQSLQRSWITLTISNIFKNLEQLTTQLIFTCSKSTIGTLENGVKYFQS